MRRRSPEPEGTYEQTLEFTLRRVRERVGQ
jgi:hypothetical protein